MQLTVTGLKEMQAAVRALATAFPTKAKRGLVRGCEGIMTRSKEDFVPVKTGNLASTGRVTPDPNPLVISAALSFGGPAASYAEAVHEIKRYHVHGQWHYLSQPIEEGIAGVQASILEEVMQ